jgi:hypothetical protein
MKELKLIELKEVSGALSPIEEAIDSIIDIIERLLK